MSLIDDQKTRVRSLDEQKVAQMQKDMEARRKAMLKSMEDSDVKLKSLLRANPQRHPDQAKQAAPKPGR